MVVSGYDGLLHQTELTYLPTSLVRHGQAHRGPVDGVGHLLVSEFPNVGGKSCAVLFLAVGEGIFVVVESCLESIGS